MFCLILHTHDDQLSVSSNHWWMVVVGRAHLEASAERWSRLLGLLEELWRWICMKDEDLAKQMPIGGDVPTLLQQQNHCTVRRDDTK